MANWKVSPYYKKSCEEHEHYTKDDMTIIRKTGYRGASFYVETNDDNPPEFEFDFVPGGDGRQDSIDMYNCYGSNIENVELDSMDDGWYGEADYPKEMSDEERQRLDELWDENGYDGWESDGWYQSETEVWLEGPIEILNEDGEIVLVVNQ